MIARLSESGRNQIVRKIRGSGLALGLVALGLALGVGSQVLAMLNADKPIMQWPDLLDQPRPAPDRTIAYGQDSLQLVDLWLPAGKGPHPVVVMIHGGCWQTEIATRDIMNYIADDLRKDGIAVWNIEYRGVDRGGGFPGTYLDIGAAADLLGAQARALNLDLTHTIAIGHSAGGHLALWLAARQALPGASPCAASTRCASTPRSARRALPICARPCSARAMPAVPTRQGRWRAPGSR